MSLIPGTNPFGAAPLSTSIQALTPQNPSLLNSQINWKETPETHVFRADISGLKKEEVKVEVEDGRVLQISGERNMEKEDKNDGFHRVATSSGRFMRSFTLPTNARMDQVMASMDNGVLTVTVPKEEVKPAIENSN